MGVQKIFCTCCTVERPRVEPRQSESVFRARHRRPRHHDLGHTCKAGYYDARLIHFDVPDLTGQSPFYWRDINESQCLHRRYLTTIVLHYGNCANKDGSVHYVT